MHLDGWFEEGGLGGIRQDGDEGRDVSLILPRETGPAAIKHMSMHLMPVDQSG